jgi:hypothetical protein
MGIQLRKVAANWQHPKDEKGNYIPLLEYRFSKQLAEWQEGKEKWEQGFSENWFPKENESKWKPKTEEENKMTWEEWTSEMPVKEDYMPEWSEEEKTHIQLYENTTEGTPTTPVFKADELEKLCEYAAENCSTFADFKKTKEEWFKMLSDGFVCHEQGNIIFV